MGVLLKLALLGALCSVGLLACGEGLGECDQTALGTPAAGMPYEGQGIVAGKCAGGRCHSAGAMGAGRVGAPAELNFDVVVGSASEADLAEQRRSSATVTDWAEDIWGEVKDGEMPPPTPAGSGELNGDDKEKVRNWLACGAPVMPPDPSAATATWDSIWGQLAFSCTSCHGSLPAAAGGGFVLGEDACSSYHNIFMVASMNVSCGTRITASNPPASLLYQKITGTQPAGCGSPMPPLGWRWA